MGANSSIFLHPELRADDDTVTAFQEFENECISRNLKANEIYDLLNEKYDHLLGREMEKKITEIVCATSQAVVLPPVQTAEVSTQTNKVYRKSRKMNKPLKPLDSSSLRSVSTTSSQSRTRLPPLKEGSKTVHRTPSEDSDMFPRSRKASLPKQKVGKTFGSLSRPRLPALQSVSCDAADNYHNSPFLSTPGSLEATRSNSSDSLTVTECYDGLHSLSLDDMDHLTDDEESDHFNEKELCPEDLTTASCCAAESVGQRRKSICDDFLGLNHFECRLCKKKFGSSELLETHIAFSQTHKDAVQRIRGKYVRAFRDADRVGTLLRKATDRFQRVLQSKKDFVDGKISAEKLRWQRAIGKVISQFTAKQIEKIMQELQEEEDYEKAAVAAAETTAAPQAGVLMFTSSRFFWRTKSRFNVYVLFHKHCRALEVICVCMPEKNISLDSNNTTNNNNSNVPKLAPRIFLSMDKLEVQHDAWNVTDAAVASHSNEVISAEDTGITRAMKIVRDVVQCLKIDFDAVNRGEKPAEMALFYDDSMSQMRSLPSPLLTTAPNNLILTPTEGFCRLDADEAMVQSKLQELTQAQKLLAEAVDTAEEMVNRVNCRNSPRRRPLLLSPLALAKAVFSPKAFPAKFAF